MEASRWTRVEDDLPPVRQESKEFMISDDLLVRFEDRTLVAYYTRANNPIAKGWWHMPWGKRLEGVTHWSVLPE